MAHSAPACPNLPLILCRPLHPASACRKAYALAFSALGFVLPLRLMVPTALFNLAVKLGSQAHRCRLECGMRGTGELLAAATRSGSCPATASLAADAAQRYYSTVVSWLRSATLSAPLLHRLRLDKASLPAGWAWTALRGTCLAQCFSVHGWQQVGGVGVPLFGFHPSFLSLAEGWAVGASVEVGGWGGGCKPWLSLSRR